MTREDGKVDSRRHILERLRTSDREVTVPDHHGPEAGPEWTRTIPGDSSDRCLEQELLRTSRESGLALTVTGGRAHLMDVLANHLYTGGHSRVLVGSGSILDAGAVGAMARRLTRVQVEHTGSGRAADVHRFDAAVVEADAVLVRTGVLVFEPGNRADLASTLLPRTQLVVCSTRRLVADFRRWLDGRPAGWNSTVVMVAGCSRTADIEKQLVLRVHGPWNVRLFVVRE